MSVIFHVFIFLTRRERVQMLVLLAFMVPNAFMQVAGVTSVVPFIAVLSDPGMIESNSLIAWIHEFLGAPRVEVFLVMLACSALILLVSSNGLAALTAWFILRFSYLRAHSLSHRLMEIYLGQPYEFFLTRNSSDLTKNVTQEVIELVRGFLMPTLQLVANVLVVAGLVVTLVVVDPLLAVTSGTVLGGAYGGIYMFFRRRVRIMGQRRLAANARRFRTTFEAFGAIKDLKVTGREGYYLKAYQRASHAYSINQARYEAIAQLPRYALEAIAFGAIILMALYLTLGERSVQGALPVVALYALAGYRMMPALQRIFDNVTKLRYSSPLVEKMRDETAIRVKLHKVDRQTPEGKVRANRPIVCREDLRLQGIVYRYPETEAPALQDIHVTIRARTSVAFVGESGSGKSTLVDVVLGLLEPQHGGIFVDGILLSASNQIRWQKQLGYVPQAIYLSDDTLRANIALGIPEDQIDDDAVVAAAKAAAIHDFITNELPDGYNTIAGDRGVRLSGGQRQRIGIARALYNDPELLILDEATSALDMATEAAVMDAIDRLAGRKTILMIAHRLSTVKNCDQLHFLEQGRLVASGSYNELFEKSVGFRRLATMAADVP